MGFGTRAAASLARGTRFVRVRHKGELVILSGTDMGIYSIVIILVILSLYLEAMESVWSTQ